MVGSFNWDISSIELTMFDFCVKIANKSFSK